MKQFIEVTVSGSRQLVNVNAIVRVKDGGGEALIIVVPSSSPEEERIIHADQTYEEVLRLIEQAL